MPDLSKRSSGSFLGRVIAGLVISGVSGQEQVWCECADPECGCQGRCRALAIYEWGSLDEEDWQYLCHRCAARMIERGTAPDVGAVTARGRPEEETPG